MKSRMVVMAVLFFGLFFGKVSFAEQGRVGVNLDLFLGDRNVAGVVGLVIHDDPIVKPTIKVFDKKSGGYVKLVASIGFDGWNQEESCSSEVDYIFGLQRSFWGVNADVRYAFYDLNNVGEVEGDLHALCGDFYFPLVYEFKPFILLEANFPTDKKILSGGFAYRVGVEVEYNLDFLNQDIVAEFSFGGNDGICGFVPEAIAFGRIKVSTVFNIGAVNITPEINYQRGVGREGGASPEEIFFGGLGFAF